MLKNWSRATGGALALVSSLRITLFRCSFLWQYSTKIQVHSLVTLGLVHNTGLTCSSTMMVLFFELNFLFNSEYGIFKHVIPRHIVFWSSKGLALFHPASVHSTFLWNQGRHFCCHYCGGNVLHGWLPPLTEGSALWSILGLVASLQQITVGQPNPKFPGAHSSSGTKMATIGYYGH